MTFFRKTQITVLAALIFASFSACSWLQPVNPFEPAETFEQNTFAALGVANITLYLAADVAEDPDLSKDAVTGILVGSEAVYTAVTATTQALKTYNSLKAENATSEKVDIAFREVTLALATLRPAVNGLMDAIQRAQGKDK